MFSNAQVKPLCRREENVSEEGWQKQAKYIIQIRFNLFEILCLRQELEYLNFTVN